MKITAFNLGNPIERDRNICMIIRKMRKLNYNLVTYEENENDDAIMEFVPKIKRKGGACFEKQSPC